jgi:hypothetical protein
MATRKPIEKRKQHQLQMKRLKKQTVTMEEMQSIMDDLEDALVAARELINPNISQSHAFTYDRIISELNELFWKYLPEDVT